MKNYPKILFIADEIPQSINASSIQFYRLFKNYPSDRLIVFGKKPDPKAKTLNCPYYELKYVFLERLRLSRFTSLLSDLQAMEFLAPMLPQSLVEVANAFKPDLVVSLMQHLTYYYPAYRFAKKEKLPFILFCHDDVEEFSRIHGGFKRKLLQLNGQIYRSASKRICISPEMAIQWKAKYGADGDFLYPVASSTLTAKEIDLDSLMPKKELKIGYAGSLAYGYKEGIDEIKPILQKTGTVLKIYRDENNLLPASENLEYAGFSRTAEETFERIKNECDAVILPYSSEQRFKALYSTHFPSKIAEYVLLGMPVIITGPDYANGLKWAKTKKGIFFGNSSSLPDILTDLKQNVSKLKKTLVALRDIKDFNHNQIKSKFLKLIDEARKTD
ncbi:glycosyltransferase [uncultured Pedobacter sp.]|uniref:glycosyltransferase n=1 Tax=uncultured Pedobacter sp. TaxID=246139 RepID=UPI0025EC02FC|nr:glycosyltransferase [uncultured Pedobacter sp.]